MNWRIGSSPFLIFLLLVALGSKSSKQQVEMVPHAVIKPQHHWGLGIYPTFIAFTYGRSMLEQTLAAYKNVDWPGIVIVDNSRAREAYRDRQLLREIYGVYQVFETEITLSFSQLQNIFNWYARKWNVSWYFWSHSDALLIPKPNISHYAEALQGIHMNARNQTKLAVVFFGYDRLAACQTKAFHEVPWDTGITHYFADCDEYYRLRHKGYSSANCSGMIGSVFNMRHVLNATLLNQALKQSDNEDEFEQRLNIVRNFVENWRQHNQLTKYHWRNSELDSLSRQTEAEKRAAAAHNQASRVYVREKYSENITCRMVEWGDKPPNFDV